MFSLIRYLIHVDIFHHLSSTSFTLYTLLSTHLFPLNFFNKNFYSDTKLRILGGVQCVSVWVKYQLLVSRYIQNISHVSRNNKTLNPIVTISVVCRQIVVLLCLVFLPFSKYV